MSRRSLPDVKIFPARESLLVNVIGVADVVEDADERKRIWEAFPEEIDLYQYFAGPDDSRFALIRVTPKRIECTHPDHPQPDVYRVD